MRLASLSLGFLACTALAACQGSDLERGLIGAGTGAAAAVATGGNPAAGAAIGGAAGVLCDDLTPGLCQDN